MVGVLIKDGLGNIIEKRVYGGDDDKSLQLINSEKLNDSKNTYTVFSDSDKEWQSSFINVSQQIVLTKEQTDWQSVKATPQALTFIAKKLGLE